MSSKTSYTAFDKKTKSKQCADCAIRHCFKNVLRLTFEAEHEEETNNKETSYRAFDKKTTLKQRAYRAARDF